jgi:hypothetical protein
MTPDTLSALEVATLVLALVGALTGVVALVWNVVVFVWSGPRVRVEIHEALTDGASMVYGPSTWTGDTMAPGVWTERAIALEVINTGRAPVTIASVGVRFSDGMEYRDTNEENFRLDAHSRHTWPIAHLPVWGQHFRQR